MISKTEEKSGKGYLIDWIAYLGDLCMINLFFTLVFTFYSHYPPLYYKIADDTSIVFLLINVAYIVTSLFVRTRLSANIIPAEKIVQKACYFIALYSLILFASFQFFRVLYLPIVQIIIIGTTLAILFCTWHLLFRLLLKAYRSKGYNYKNIIIIGSSQTAIDTYRELKTVYSGYKVLGFFSSIKRNTDQLPYYLGTRDQLMAYLSENKVDEIYDTSTEDKTQLTELIAYCEKNMIRFHIVPDLYQYVKKKLSLQFLETIPILSLRFEPLQHPLNRFFKRLMDIAISLFVIIFILPIVYLIIVPAIKLSSPGSIHFVQKRTGFRGRVFDCLKFRSMKQNDDANKKSATKGDPRVTKIGAFMRKTSIDELPQFFNVLKGDMSVVGPRPHMLKHTEEYSKLIEKFMVRHLVKPGITGWAQVTGSRGETKTVHDMEERVKKDVWYIENWTLFLDFKIIVRTVLNAFRGEDKAY